MSGLGNIFDLMKNAKQMVDKAKAAQDELAKKYVEGAAGAGMVTARLNGLGELVGLVIDKSVANPDDTEMLADLVIAAVADARAKIADLRSDAMRDLTGGMDLSSLGIDLPGLGG